MTTLGDKIASDFSRDKVDLSPAEQRRLASMIDGALYRETLQQFVPTALHPQFIREQNDVHFAAVSQERDAGAAMSDGDCDGME